MGTLFARQGDKVKSFSQISFLSVRFVSVWCSSRISSGYQLCGILNGWMTLAAILNALWHVVACFLVQQTNSLVLPGLVLRLLCLSKLCNVSFKCFINIKSGLKAINIYLLGFIDCNMDCCPLRIVPIILSRLFLRADCIESWIGWFPCFSWTLGFFGANGFNNENGAFLGGRLDFLVFLLGFP